jgi:uncharacterized protein
VAQVIIDAGPIFALLDRDEEHHEWTCARFREIKPPLLTCDAVLSEVCFLLQRRSSDVGKLRELLRRNAILSGFGITLGKDRAFELMATYQNVPMSFADACLVCMVEQTRGASLFTLDRHFTIYRQQRRRLIPLIAPF